MARKPRRNAAGFAGIAHLGELHVGQQSGAAPQAGKQKHRHHPGKQKRPPQPVPGDALGVDQAGHHQRRVGGECGRHHGRARQPPGNVASGDKIVVHALARARTEIKPQHQRDAEIEDDRRPIKQGEVHGGKEYTGPAGFPNKKVLYSSSGSACVVTPAYGLKFATCVPGQPRHYRATIQPGSGLI